MNVLVVNTGSSSVKLRLLEPGDRVLWRGDLPLREGGIGRGELREHLTEAGPIDAVGHRVVHGGSTFESAVVIDDAVIDRIEALSELAPLHQPLALDGIRLVSELLPGVPAVACFDTTFHRRLPSAASTYAIPRRWREDHGIRRYGFHGLSHAYATRRGCELVGLDPSAARIVTCHLGAGASLAAVRGGVCVDTTMGFTPLEGLVMATRSGSVDPGALLWMQRRLGLTADEMQDALEHGSGLVALAGTADMQAIVERAERGDVGASEALDVYLHRLRAGIAAMAASLGGLDLVVFTGGVGENAPEVRRRAVGPLAFLGLRLNEAANSGATADAVIGVDASDVALAVVTSREDLEIGRETRRALSGDPM